MEHPPLQHTPQNKRVSYLTSWRKVLPEELTVAQLVNNSHFVEPKHSLLSILDPILSQLNPNDTLTNYCLKFHYNILPSMPRSLKWCAASGICF